LSNVNINDLELLNYWYTKQHIIDYDPDDEWNWEIELDRNPKWKEQLVAELHAVSAVSGEPIGYIQLIDPLLKLG